MFLPGSGSTLTEAEECQRGSSGGSQTPKANRISPAGLIYQNDTCCMQLIPLAFIWIHFICLNFDAAERMDYSVNSSSSITLPNGSRMALYSPGGHGLGVSKMTSTPFDL